MGQDHAPATRGAPDEIADGLAQWVDDIPHEDGSDGSRATHPQESV